MLPDSGYKPAERPTHDPGARVLGPESGSVHENLAGPPSWLLPRRLALPPPPMLQARMPGLHAEAALRAAEATGFASTAPVGALPLRVVPRAAPPDVLHGLRLEPA